MDLLIVSAAIVIGFVIGYLLSNLLSKSKIQLESKKLSDNIQKLEKTNTELETKLQSSIEEISELQREINDWKKNFDNKTLELQNTKEELILKESELKYLNEKLANQKLEIEKLQDKFKVEFENLANKIFEEKSEKFVSINKSNLDDILTPFKEKIKEFEKKVEETYDKESREKLSLKTEIEKLYELSGKLNDEAANLTRALKGDVKQMGDWGEMILEKILEASGLEKDRMYFKQETFKTDTGQRYRPDFVVKLPENRNIIIDSKVSLLAYEKYVNAQDRKEQEKYLKEHIKSVKSHIDELSKKNYEDLYELESIDYVFMFIPIEPAFLVAIKNDSTLWQYAYDRKVLIISPTNMIAVLKITASIWQQEYQNRNVRKIAKQASDLYDKFVGFVEDLITIGNHIEKTNEFYHRAMNKLKTGKGNLIKRVENLRKLEISPKKQIPESLIEPEE